jgi:acyl dehydratase
MATRSAIAVGDELPPLTKGPVTRQHLAEWCAAENDYYAIHYDEQAAKAMGLPGSPVQGTYKYALLGQLIARWLGEAGVLTRIDCTYRGLTLAGETLTARGRVTAVATNGTVELSLLVENERGEVSSTGSATVCIVAGMQSS